MQTFSQTITNKELKNLVNRLDVEVEGTVTSIYYSEIDFELTATLNVNDCEYDVELYGEDEEIALTDEQKDYIAHVLELHYLNVVEDFGKSYARLSKVTESFGEEKEEFNQAA
ncbi:protein of unknown function [Tenacibaculum sp. 190524A02b]|uniref:hypothetical protein n=1 Tax=Tenacibaculum vairaonense TaxID=3137860 RepID=UPI0032B2A2AE